MFLTLNASKGRGGGAAAPFGGFYGTEHVPKMSLKCPENVQRHFRDIFFDMFWTFCRRPTRTTRTFSGHFLDIFLGAFAAMMSGEE